jgi:hypothetical protein
MDPNPDTGRWCKPTSTPPSHQSCGSTKVRGVEPYPLVAVVQRYKNRRTRASDALPSVLNGMFAYALELGLRDDHPMGGVTRRETGYQPCNRERVHSDNEIHLL